MCRDCRATIRCPGLAEGHRVHMDRNDSAAVRVRYRGSHQSSHRETALHIRTRRALIDYSF
jgi:hypothetical protein